MKRNSSIQIEITKKYKLETLELKNTKVEIKNSLDGFNSRNKMEKQSISDLGEEKK